MKVITSKIKPKPGQESVWDYPRPPRLAESDAHITIIFNNEILADTKNSKRILETSHPPVYYLPPEDIAMKYLKKVSGKSYCEWKGVASYYSVEVGDKILEKIAWYYPDPMSDYSLIKNHIAFYAAPMDQCRVNGEIVKPQPGGFYGGWITSNIVGPFKGNPGSFLW
jgi:uncharacterized protein (DUF427 family)